MIRSANPIATTRREYALANQISGFLCWQAWRFLLICTRESKTREGRETDRQTNRQREREGERERERIGKLAACRVFWSTCVLLVTGLSLLGWKGIYCGTFCHQGTFCHHWWQQDSSFKAIFTWASKEETNGQTEREGGRGWGGVKRERGV